MKTLRKIILPLFVLLVSSCTTKSEISNEVYSYDDLMKFLQLNYSDIHAMIDNDDLAFKKEPNVNIVNGVYFEEGDGDYGIGDPRNQALCIDDVWVCFITISENKVENEDQTNYQNGTLILSTPHTPSVYHFEDLIVSNSPIGAEDAQYWAAKNWQPDVFLKWE